MSNDNNKQAIYIEYDALIDTRLGTLARINSDVAKSVLESGTYHTRLNNEFPGIDKTEFAEMYQKRDVDTLKMSIVTNAIRLLVDLVGTLAEQAIATPYHGGSKIVVNTYPYKLSAEEKDTIGLAIRGWIGNLAPVELVHIATKDLTPRYCKDTYTLMIVYDHQEWMTTHAQAFIETRLPEVTMYVPALYFENTPTTEELEKLYKEAAHPMIALEMLASPIIQLKVIDVSFFSILTSNKKPAHAP